MLFYGIRHGECDRDPSSQKYVDDHVTLNDKGVIQMSNCGVSLKETVFHPFSRFIVYTSPLRRVVDSAILIKNFVETKESGWECGEIRIDERLSNKQLDETVFESSLRSFLEDLKNNRECMMIVVTHGRILKMLNSFCRFGHLDSVYTHQLPNFYQDRVYNFFFPYLNREWIHLDQEVIEF